MTQRREIHLYDDLDETPIRPGRGETVRFALDGVSYEIDLTTRHAADLRKALAPYLAGARRKVPPRARRGHGAGASRSDLRAIRAWARVNGYEISDRGRVSAEIQSAYDAAR